MAQIGKEALRAHANEILALSKNANDFGEKENILSHGALNALKLARCVLRSTIRNAEQLSDITDEEAIMYWEIKQMIAPNDSLTKKTNNVARRCADVESLIRKSHARKKSARLPVDKFEITVS
jgi:hypothetical protein